MLGRKALLGIIIELLVTFLKIVPSIFIYNIFPAEYFGLIGFAASFISLFSIFSGIGIEDAHVSVMNQKAFDEKTCMGSFLFLKIIALGIMYILMFLYIFFEFDNFPDLFTPFQNLTIGLALLSSFLLNIVTILNFTFIAKIKTANLQVPRIITTVIELILLFGVILLFQNFIFYLMIGSIAISVELIWKLFLLKEVKISRPSKPVIKAYLNNIVVIAPVAIMMLFTSNFSVILLRLNTTAVVVGLLYIAQKLISYIDLISSFLCRLIFPVQTRFIDEGNFKKLGEFTNILIRYFMILFIPLCLVFIYAAPSILTFLFGPGTLPAVFFFQMTILSFLLWTVSFPYRQEILIFSGITSKNEAKAAMRKKMRKGYYSIYILTTILYTFFYILFIPSDIFGIPMLNLGLDGFAIATFLTAIIIFIVQVYIIHKLRGYKLEKNQMKILGAVLAQGLVIVIASLYLNQTIEVQLIMSVVSLGIFFGLLLIWKEITKNDFNYFKNVINFRKMAEYIKSEMSSDSPPKD